LVSRKEDGAVDLDALAPSDELKHVTEIIRKRTRKSYQSQMTDLGETARCGGENRKRLDQVTLEDAAQKKQVAAQGGANFNIDVSNVVDHLKKIVHYQRIEIAHLQTRARVLPAPMGRDDICNDTMPKHVSVDKFATETHQESGVYDEHDIKSKVDEFGQRITMLHIIGASTIKARQTLASS
jgi:hypothetical protein